MLVALAPTKIPSGDLLSNINNSTYKSKAEIALINVLITVQTVIVIFITFFDVVYKTKTNELHFYYNDNRVFFEL